MKITEKDREVLDLGEGNQVLVKYQLKFWDKDDNPIENQPVQVFEGEQLIFDTNTDLYGEAEIAVIADIIKETSKQVTIVVDGERRNQVLLFEFGVKKREERMKALEEEQRAKKEALEEEQRVKKEALEEEQRVKKEALEEEQRVKKEEIEDCRKRINACERFFPDFGIGIVADRRDEVVINEKGQLLCSNRFDGIDDFGTLAVTVARYYAKYYLINANGKILSDWYDKIVLEEDKKIAKVKRGEKYNLIDLNGKLVFIKWIDSIEDCAIKGAWVLKFDDGYCVIDPKNRMFAIGPNEENFRSVRPIGEGLLEVVTLDNKKYELNSRFEMREIVSFLTEHLYKLLNAKRITAAENEKLRTLIQTYETAVKSAKALHPEGKVPTIDRIEMELMQLSAAELKKICTHIQIPVLVIEPARAFEENIKAMSGPVSFTSRNGETKREELATVYFANSEHSILKGIYKSLPRKEAVTVHIAEGNIHVEEKSFSDYKFRHYSPSERAISNMGIEAYQSMLMGSILDQKEQKTDTIIDQSITILGTPALLVSGDTVVLSYSSAVNKSNRLCHITLLAIPAGECYTDIRQYYPRYSMKLFEFSPEDEGPARLSPPPR